jgi:BirA family transcriptional regulator, biotin operon repressor / biotin---[acetyl-CoA-carboxylase] ligase
MQTEDLLRRLADGRVRSGARLAEECGVTRAAIWKHVAKLEQWGVVVQAVRGRGYRLELPVDLLDSTRLLADLRASESPVVRFVDVLLTTSSTNQILLERDPPPPGVLDVCLAEHQSAGRGRRGRTWQAPLGAGLWLSTSWQFAEMPPQLSALTLAVGVVVRRVLRETAAVEIQLKWPNDLVHADAKLGGILVEMSVEAHGGCRVVAGIGINVALPTSMHATLSDWPGGATDLARAMGRAPPPRTALAGRLIMALRQLFARYSRDGFAPYRDEWLSADYLQGKPIDLSDSSGTSHGTAAGIETDGALLVDMSSGDRRRVLSGDVSVRPQP